MKMPLQEPPTSRFNVPITEELLRDITRKAVENFHPQKIVLFGSRAWGVPRGDSDLDLLVIMKSRLRPMERATRFRERCRPRFVTMDVIVRTPAEIRKRIQMKDPFFIDIMQRGRVLYEA